MPVVLQVCTCLTVCHYRFMGYTLRRRGRRHKSERLPNSTKSMGKEDTTSRVNQP